MTDLQLLDKAVERLKLNYFEIEKYQRVSDLRITKDAMSNSYYEQMHVTTSDAIMIWLKTGENKKENVEE